jgi:hypothetical protein
MDTRVSLLHPLSLTPSLATTRLWPLHVSGHYTSLAITRLWPLQLDTRAYLDQNPI